MQIDLLQASPVVGGAEEALARLDTALADAKARGSELLITPEMYLTGYNIGAARVNALAEPADGPMIVGLADLARKHGVAVLTGFPERAGGVVYNAGILLDADGSPVVGFRKTHLYGEADRAMFTAGDRLAPVVVFRGWRVGFAICYDIEFPELTRCHAQAGAEVVLCPTANMRPYYGIPNRIVPARAEENEIYVAYANYVGSEGEFDYCGLSCLAGPDGDDRARASLDAEEVVTATLDRADFERIRETSTHYRDLRPELYRS
ncbi:carbon-nitrogen hydrolase family protein [Paracoccus methylarcula]|uniref:Carbon-nitrogen hydrolase n=1 Tax=Paracoccus methylarcula TaxID=72022 RepID=A0A3R7PPC5_9RHOB|nr:carbon-nitrogen hydrolase family protein [Paracoccus methylarcula]RNF34165.1 carbon-nitrogen hydrolase [Paracoccus methylarcula]